MTLIQAPDPVITPFKTIFLAGSITGATDWQSKVVSEFKANALTRITLLNPRRSTPYSPEMDSLQIPWEYNALRKADIIFFYFSNETVAPITLFELGAALERDNQTLVISAHKDYPRLRDLHLQTSLKRGQYVSTGLDVGIGRLMEEAIKIL
jgi:hypothetical protein